LSVSAKQYVIYNWRSVLSSMWLITYNHWTVMVPVQGSTQNIQLWCWDSQILVYYLFLQ